MKNQRKVIRGGILILIEFCIYITGGFFNQIEVFPNNNGAGLDRIEPLNEFDIICFLFCAFYNVPVFFFFDNVKIPHIIGEMVGNNPLPEQHKDAMTQLVEERERLQGLLKSIRESIDNIKSEYPYTMKDILEDTEKTEQKKQELENILEQYNELISIYKAKIEEMLR